MDYETVYEHSNEHTCWECDFSNQIENEWWCQHEDIDQDAWTKWSIERAETNMEAVGVFSGCPLLKKRVIIMEVDGHDCPFKKGYCNHPDLSKSTTNYNCDNKICPLPFVDEKPNL